MQIIRQKIVFNGHTGDTMNLRFPLSLCDDFLGYQQEIDNLTQFVSLDLVNPVTDLEKRRFKPLNSILLAPKLNFTFTTMSFTNGADMFTAKEVNGNSDNFLNSFFIMDFYDTYDIYTQTKIFTTYLTKKGATPTYTVNSGNQLYYWYIPVSLIKAQTDLNNIQYTGYVKFSFYNAKTGKLILFYNQDNNALTTPEKLFFKAELNLITKTWKFLTTNPPNVNAVQIANNAYVNKVNTTVENKDNLAQNPPSGDTFTYVNGKGAYLTT